MPVNRFLTLKRTPLYWIGLSAFAVLLAFSLLFYLERMAFVDGAFHIFFILKDHSPAIYHNRIGGVFTQLIPWLGAEWGGSLKTVAMAYSASYYALYLLAFVALARWLKNEKMALAFLLFHTLMATHVFYLMITELYQGLALLFLYLAALEKGMKPWKLGVLTAVLIPVIGLSHPLMLFPFTFMMAFLALSYPGRWRIFLAVFLFFMMVYAGKTWVFPAAYDHTALAGLKNLRKFYPDYWSLPAFRNFFGYLWRDYYFLVAGLAVSAGFYILRKKYGKLLLLLLSFTGLAFLINIIYAHGAVQYYVEHQYQLLAIFVAFPLVYDLFPEIKRQWVVPALVGLVVAACLLRVYGAHTPYTKRLNWLRGFMEETSMWEDRKLILRADQVPMDKLFQTWAISYECWLISTIEQGETRSVIVEEKSGEFDKHLEKNKAFIAKWGAFDYGEFDPEYFVLKDTSHYVKYEPPGQ